MKSCCFTARPERNHTISRVVDRLLFSSSASAPKDSIIGKRNGVIAQVTSAMWSSMFRRLLFITILGLVGLIIGMQQSQARRSNASWNLSRIAPRLT
jgi:hypothetical protein